MRRLRNLRVIFLNLALILLINAVPYSGVYGAEETEKSFDSLLKEMTEIYKNDPEAQKRQDEADFPRRKLRVKASKDSVLYGLKESGAVTSGSAIERYNAVRQDVSKTAGVVELTFANSTDTRIAYDKLKADKSVISVTPIAYASAGDTIYNTYPYISWGVKNIGADKFVNMLRSNNIEAKITVAVLSTGIDTQHSFIKDKIIIPGKYKNSPEDLKDETGKGTHLAGVILDTAGEYVSIMPFKVLSGKSNTGKSVEDICLNIKYAADEGADIICLGFSDTTEAHQASYKEAIEYASSKGAAVISAAGDSSKEISNYFEGAIVVSVTDVNNKSAVNGNFGPAVDLSAPGINVYGSMTNNSYGLNSGTSVAAAHTSAAAALLKAVDGSLSAGDIKTILKENTFSPSVWDASKYGYGVLNLQKLLK